MNYYYWPPQKECLIALHSMLFSQILHCIGISDLVISLKEATQVKYLLLFVMAGY